MIATMRLPHWLAVLAALPLDAQEYLDLPWRLSEQGRLEVHALADSVDATTPQYGEWLPMFPRLFERSTLGEYPAVLDYGWGPFLVLPLLIHGDGGAAAIDDATLRLRKLSLGVTCHPILLKQLKADPLVDLLRIRHLESIEVLAADSVLRDCASDSKRDGFVRAAAARTLADRLRAQGEPVYDELSAVLAKRNGAAALQAALARAPDDADLLIGLHGAAMPSTAPLLAAWHALMLRFTSTVYLAADGSLSPMEYSKGEILANRPGQLPCELAAVFGNWRVDHALFAMRRGEPDAWWVHLGGVFQPPRIAAGLHSIGGEATLDEGGELRGSWLDWSVRATATELEAWPSAMPVGPRGARLAELHGRAAANEAPAWLLLPATSRLGSELGAAGCALDVRLQLSPRTLTATALCPDAATAERLAAKWREWQARYTCAPTDKVPGEDVTWASAAEQPPGAAEDRRTRLVWRRCVQAAQVSSTAATVRWSLDLAPFALVDLVRFLGSSPMDILRYL